MIAYFNGFRVSCALEKQVLPVYLFNFIYFFSFCTKWCLMHIVFIYPEEIKNKVHIENSCFLPLIYCR